MAGRLLGEVHKATELRRVDIVWIWIVSSIACVGLPVSPTPIHTHTHSVYLSPILSLPLSVSVAPCCHAISGAWAAP